MRIELKRVFPAALDYLAMTLFIMPKAYREKVGVQDYSQHPIGAGPYKITKVNGVTEIDLERYDGYYADSPKGKPAISKIVIHEVPDSATEMAELLGAAPTGSGSSALTNSMRSATCRTSRRCAVNRCASSISAWTARAVPAPTIR